MFVYVAVWFVYVQWTGDIYYKSSRFPDWSGHQEEVVASELTTSSSVILSWHCTQFISHYKSWWIKGMQPTFA